jgi:hypothetical protein
MAKFIPICFLLIAALPVQAATCSAKSGATTTALLELYTSEGCSSCPPADKWVSGLKIKPDKLVPLALHVGYWDYIGWKDEFAQPPFSRRQSDYATLHHSSSVFTPQTVVNGKNVRTGSDAKLAEALSEINAMPARADISLTLNRETNGKLEIHTTGVVTDQASRVQSAAYIAVYENRLSNQVKAGENSGVRLDHDYVVRELIGPLALDADGKLAAERSLTLKPEWKTRDLGVAAFVQNRANGEVLQVLALPLCSS